MGVLHAFLEFFLESSAFLLVFFFEQGLNRGAYLVFRQVGEGAVDGEAQLFSLAFSFALFALDFDALLFFLVLFLDGLEAFFAFLAAEFEAFFEVFLLLLALFFHDLLEFAFGLEQAFLVAVNVLGRGGVFNLLFKEFPLIFQLLFAGSQFVFVLVSLFGEREEFFVLRSASRCLL